MSKNTYWIWLLTAPIAGIALTLAFAPYSYPYFAILALLFLYRSWSIFTVKQCLLIAFLFSLGLYGLGTWWTYISVHDYGGADAISASLISFLLVAVMALFPMLTAAIIKKLVNTDHLGLKIAGSAFVWVAVEYIRGYVILNGFPWLQIAYSQTDTPLAGYAPILGVYGIGFLLASSAFVLMEMLVNKRIIKIGFVFLLITWGGGQLLKTITWTHSIGDAISLTLIQGNIAQSEKWQPEARINTLKLYQSLTEQHWQDSQVIIWPETAIPAFYHQVQGFFLKPLAEQAAQHHVDLVVSMPTKGEGKDYYNSVVVLGAEQRFYHKHHLLPFGEYLPLQPLSGWILDKLNIPLGDFAAGADKQALLSAGGYPFQTTICYEDVFGSELSRQIAEATYIVNVTNDAWFGDSSQPYQHFQMSRMRALEMGRYLVRATNTGLTGFIAPNGKVIQQAPILTTTTITNQIYPMAGITPYAQLGDKLIFLLLISLVSILYGHYQYGKSQ